MAPKYKIGFTVAIKVIDGTITSLSSPTPSIFKPRCIAEVPEFNATEYFEDGQEFELYDSENEKEENIKISKAEDCARVMMLKYTNDEINCSDYVEESENPHNNGCDDEFEDGYGDEEFDTIKLPLH